jgi:hypothetical protein
MIYEVRTYTLRTGAVAEFEDRFTKRKPLREKHSKLGRSASDPGPSTRSSRLATNLHRTGPRRDGDAELQQLPGGRDLIVCGSRHHDPGPLHAPG